MSQTTPQLLSSFVKTLLAQVLSCCMGSFLPASSTHRCTYNRVVDGWTRVEAAGAWWWASRVRGEEYEGENDEGDNNAATVGHPSLSLVEEVGDVACRDEV